MGNRISDQISVSTFTNGHYMDKKDSGLFSQSLRSLEIQLKTLFYGSGNDKSIAFLDSLSNLGFVEQEIVLKHFTRVIEAILAGDRRWLTEEDQLQKEMEDQIYSDIISAMNEAVKVEKLSGRRLEVLNGGRKEASKQVLNLSKARKSRRSIIKPVLN